jgi:hypothetical protein
MLFGGFAESKPSSGEWCVRLPEDDSSAMVVLLSMIHARYRDVPKALPKTQLYNLMVLTDKYDCTTMARPWASSWLKDLDDIPSGDPQNVWIVWNLGDYDLFAVEYDSFLLRSSIDAAGDLKCVNRMPLDDYRDMLAVMDITG